MARRPALSKAEMEVVRIVWNLGEATVRQALDAFPTQRNIDFTTFRRISAAWKRKVICGRNARGGPWCIARACGPTT